MNQKRPFKILGIDHLGLAAKDPHKCIQFLTLLLQEETPAIETIKDQEVKTTMFHSLEDVQKLNHLEILEPTAENSPIQKFLEKKGGGIHHLALRVDSLEKALDWLKENQVELIDSHPRLGAGNKEIAFIHPRSTGGILIELSEINSE